MFWANNYVSSPHIEALLNKENVTLHELMDEEDILQECKSQNKKLVEYLTRPEVMEELVTLTTKEPSTEIEERWRYKYPNVACELLTCDVPTLNEKLAGDETLLAKLYSFLDTDKPLNPLLASFFSKTIGVLIARKSDQVLEFLKSRQTCVDLLLQHLETPAIMDLILKLVTQVEGSDMRQNILNWLDSQRLVQRLVKLLAPSSEPSKHANAAQLLCDMVNVARENQRTSTTRTDPDPILNALESGETVSLLLETILTGEKLESSIVGGIQVLLVLLGQKLHNITDEEDVRINGIGNEVVDHEQRIKISNSILPYFEQLNKLLLDPPYKPPVRTTAGVLECPLGNTRLHVAKLAMALLTTENVKTVETLVELGTFQILLDLFFKYTWNNFLHTQVRQCLALAINSDWKHANELIYTNIFIKCKLIELILEAWEKNESKQNEENGVRQGYMGHLINIANNVVNQREKSKTLGNYLKSNLSDDTLSKWDSFVNKQLARANKASHTSLGDPVIVCVDSELEEGGDEYNSYSQQIYSYYQEQQMTPQLIEKFGFHDDEFNDGDDALHEEDLDKREDMFNKICQQKQKAGLEDCSACVEWGDEGELTFQTVVDKRDWPSKQQHNDSNSSDEDDEDPRDMHMEIDSTDPWDSTETLPANTALPEVNPWDVVPSEPVESTGWANFDNFESTLNIENTVIVDNKLCDEVKKVTTVATTTTTTTTTADPSKKEAVLENKVTSPVENVGAGDAKQKSSESNVGSTSSSHIEMNLNNKSAEDSLYSVCTADKNANPSEVLGNRETESGEDSKSTEIVTTRVESERSSSDYNVISCTLKTASPDGVLPPKDAK